MSIGEAMGIVTNIETIHATHVATQTYGVCTQWQPHANQQNTIQTTHRTWKTMPTCKLSLLYCGELGHIVLVQRNVFNMQHTPQLLPQPKGQKKRETRTSSLSKDLEIGPQCIMNLKQSYLVFKTNTLFLLFITIKGGKSTTVWTQTFLN
jgi:hypothetical protein